MFIDLEEEFIKIVIEFNKIQSLARAILESTQNDDSFEPCDCEHLAEILLVKTTKTQKIIETAEQKILLALRN